MRVTEAQRREVMAKMVHTGILILEDERMDIGYSLIRNALVLGRDAHILGKPCLVLHGFTPRGFDKLREFDATLVTTEKVRDSAKRL